MFVGEQMNSEISRVFEEEVTKLDVSWASDRTGEGNNAHLPLPVTQAVWGPVFSAGKTGSGYLSSRDCMKANYNTSAPEMKMSIEFAHNCFL